MFKEKVVDKVKFKGTMTKWPLQKRTQQTKQAEYVVTIIQHDLFSYIL